MSDGQKTPSVFVVRNSNRDVSCVHSDAERAERCRLVKNAAYPDYVLSASDFRGYTVEPMVFCEGPFRAAQSPPSSPSESGSSEVCDFIPGSAELEDPK
jgi:hypothetical protein